MKELTWWVDKPVILSDTWCEAFNLSLGSWCICWNGSCLGSFEVSTFLGSGVFTRVHCWSDCEAVYSIGCWNILWIPWLFLDGLPLLGMVFMSVVSLFNSLQEGMLQCSYTVMVVNVFCHWKMKTRQYY